MHIQPAVTHHHVLEAPQGNLGVASRALVSVAGTGRTSLGGRDYRLQRGQQTVEMQATR